MDEEHLLLQTLHNTHEVFDGKMSWILRDLEKFPNGARTDVLAKLTGWKQDIRTLQCTKYITTDKKKILLFNQDPIYPTKNIKQLDQKYTHQHLMNLHIKPISTDRFSPFIAVMFFRQESC